MYSPEQIEQIRQYLIQLGYSEEHRLVRTLDANTSLNTVDEYGLTPLRRAIQKQNHDLIKYLFEIEPNPEHLSAYDKAVIDFVVQGNEQAFEELPLPRWNELAQCFQALYSLDPNLTDNGICFGFTQMYHQAFALEETDVFFNRIKNIQSNVWPLVDKAMKEVYRENFGTPLELEPYFIKVRKKIEDQFPYEIWYDLYAFFDGVISYLFPQDVAEIFPPLTLIRQLELPAQSIVQPERLKANEAVLPSSYVFSGYFSVERLLKFFTCLENAFKTIDTPIVFDLDTRVHIYSIRYFEGKWSIIAINNIDASKQEYTTAELTDNIFDTIFTVKTFIAPNASVPLQKALDALKEDPQWTEIQDSFTEEVYLKERQGETLLSIAASNNDIERVKHCLSLYPKCSTQYGKAFNSPLLIAAANNYSDLFQEVLKALDTQPDDINKTQTLNHALFYAVYAGNTDMVEALLMRDADPNRTVSTSRDWLRWLKVAKTANRHKELAHLFEQAGVKNGEISDFNSLHEAVFWGNAEMVRLLERYGALWVDPNNKISLYHLAVAMDHTHLMPEALKSIHNATQKMSPLLESYKKSRDQRFYLKDQLFSQDKKAREAFIKKMGEGSHFFDSGIPGMIEELEKGMEQFPGVHFKTTLSKIILELMEPTPEEDCSEEAQELLEQLEEIHSEYVLQVRHLYSKIESMQVFAAQLCPEEAETVTRLSANLKKDLDYFICQNGNQLPDPEALDQFKIKFKARIHSEDDLMSQQENWNSFALNLFLGLISVGIALAAKAIYSQITTNQWTLFARDTLKQHQTCGVALAVSELNI